MKKTAAKVASDAKSFQLYVKEMDVDVGVCPTVEQTVDYLVWLSTHRQRACLAQRDMSTPRLKGVVRRTAKNMLTELWKHDWPRRYPGFAAMDKGRRAGFEQEVLDAFSGLHKETTALAEAATSTSAGDGAPSDGVAAVDAIGALDAAERAQQLVAQTAPVTERKHFYRTEVYQIQDVLLAEEGAGARTRRSRSAPPRRSCRRPRRARAC